MKIYVEPVGADDLLLKLLMQAGHEVCDIKQFTPAPVVDPDAWRRLTTMEAVYRWHGLEDGYVPDLSGFPVFMRGYKAAEFTAQLMAAAINGDWVADWSNTNQRKYYPWWGVSGRGLSLYGVDYVAAAADVGPRLCFESEEKANHAVKYFTPVFEDHYFTV